MRGSVRDSPFKIRGVVEGFYGTFYTFAERNDLIRFLGARGGNFYLYGPKNDRQHRMRWWEPYPTAVLDDFGETIRIADQSGVTFSYAISFGVEPDYTSDGDFAIVTGKLGELFDRGCRAFAVHFDDLPGEFGRQVNRDAFESLADAHAGWSNRLLAWATERDPSCSLLMCPTDYSGSPPFSAYTGRLGTLLDPRIPALYTGPDVCSPTISRQDAEAFAEAIGRRPIIWDNYPVNDGGMRFDLHVGPLQGRAADLAAACDGLLANPMNQMEASKIALATVADYVNAPEAYDPAESWTRALNEIAGEESCEALRRFAENSLRSPIHRDQAPELSRLVKDATAALRGGGPVAGSAVAALSAYLDLLDESTYHLKNRMRNLALRQSILPWIETLESRLWLCRRAVQTLEAIETGGDVRGRLRLLEECLAENRNNRIRIGGTAPLVFGRYARSRAREVLGA